MTNPSYSGAANAGMGEFHAPGSSTYREVVARAPAILGATPEYIGLARPGNAQELSSVLRWARAKGLGILRLYNRSAVGARLHGDGRTLIVELGRMNRIVEVNASYAYARVEPGVSFAQLAAHLKEHSLPLLVDSERDPSASIAGSIFSKGFGYTPYADHTLVQCGAEYVLPDGDLLRSGMGAMPDNRAWQLYKYALGPYSDGLAVQSDLMIPTQTGIWLMGHVPASRMFAVELADDHALGRALEALRVLKINGTLPGTVCITHHEFDARRSGSARREAAWRLHGAVYGIPKGVELTMAGVEASFAGLQGAKWRTETELSADPLWHEQAGLMAGQPGLGPPSFSASKSMHGATLTFVAPIEDVPAQAMLRISRAATSSSRMPFLTELSAMGRSLLQTLYLPYRNRSAVGLRRVEEVARKLIADMGSAGFGLARESPELGRLAEAAMAGRALGNVQQRILAAFTNTNRSSPLPGGQR